MRNLKKVLSLALALVMLLGMMIVGAGAVDTGFKDDAGIKDDFKTAAAITKALNIMQGSNGNLNPTGKIVRAEAFILSLRVDGSNADKIAQNWPVSAKPFNDVPTSKWYASYMAYGKEMGLIAGSGGNYNPDGNITVVEYSILLLKQLGFDPARYTGAQWNINAANDALAAGLYEGLGNVNYYNHQLTRQEACQMAFNAILYSPEGEKTVYTVNRKTFNSAADAYFYSQGNGTLDEESGNTVYPAVGMTTVYPGSLAEKVFGLNQSSGNATDVDEFGRPSTVWTADKYNLELTIPNSVSYSYGGKVTNKTVRTALGAGVLKYTNWTEVVDGVSSSSSVPANNSNAYAGSQAGSVTEVFVDTDAKSVTAVTINTYVGEVTKVNEAKGSSERYVTLKGGATFTTEDFAAKDVVLYTKSIDEDGVETIQSMELADEVTGTLTRKVVGSSAAKHTYTVGGNKYGWSGTPEATDIAQTRIGSDVTLYLDTQGNIVKVKGTANQPDRYIYILANPTAKENPDYITGVKDVVEVYGVLSDGTVGKYTVKSVVETLTTNNTNGAVGSYAHTPPDGSSNVTVQCTVTSSSSSINGKLIPGTRDDDGREYGHEDNPFRYEVYVEKTDLADKVYQYTLDGNGYLSLTKEIDAKNSASFDNNDRVVDDTKILNSSTVFVFVQTEGGDNKTVKDVTVQTGIANIGKDIAADTAFMALDSKNVAKVVFVSTAYVAGVEDTGSLFYVTGVTQIQTTTSGSLYIVEGIDENGEDVELETNQVVNEDEVWSLNDEGGLAIKQTTSVNDVLEINGNNIKVSGADTRRFVTDETKIVDLTGEGLDEIAVGQRVIIVKSTVTGKTGNIRVAFIVEAANNTVAQPTVSTVPTGDQAPEGDDSNKPSATVTKIVEVGAGMSFRLPASSGPVDNDHAVKINDNVITDWGDVEETQGFTFPIKKGTDDTSDRGKGFVLIVRDSSGTVAYTEAVECSGKVATGVFYINPAGTRFTTNTYFWSVEKYANRAAADAAMSSETFEGNEVAHGSFDYTAPGDR